ncbi:MAG: Ribosomal RNA large subunit methyltransferase G [Candidatus Erwinia impunctatus]|nr:Ribosomal RNA large subunit methyltransferase G [Culicoides impunctatus]
MSQLVLSDRTLQLQRFPPLRDGSPLQAWDAADEYLLDHCATQPASGVILIFNDAFGALACALASEECYSISDSLLSRIATRENLAQNAADASQVTLLDSLAPLPSAPSRVLIKIPKTLALLEYQLRTLRAVVTPETVIVAAGKVKEIHSSTLQLFARVLGPVTTSLAVKKARLICCQPTLPALADDAMIQSWPLENSPYCIHNHANVFSRTGLDIGTRRLMMNLPRDLPGNIADLGCGNGVIGLSLLTENPQAEIHFIDESSMAVASSQLNVHLNRPQDEARCHFIVNNALQGFPANHFSAVLCNPPFHQQNSLTDEIAWQMFCDAWRCLQQGGELRVVGNRHLDYYRKLKKVFGNCTTLDADKKFVVLRSVKLRHSKGW